MVEGAGDDISNGTKISRLWRRLLGMVPNWILGLWLLAIYCLLLTYTVFAFSAYQLHLSLSSADANGSALSIDELIDRNNNLRSIQSVIYENYSDRDAAILQRLAKVKIKNDYDKEKTRIYDECRRRISDFKLSIDRNYSSSVEFCQSDNPDSKAHPEISQIISSSIEKINNVNAGIYEVGKDLKQIQGDLERIDAEIERNREEEDGLTSSWTPQMRGLVVKINYFQNAGHDGITSYILPDFINISEDVLALIIVLSMGAIGGALHITRNFLAAENAEDIDTYLVRYRYIFLQPFLGAFTAFAVYIFVRAGVIVMSSSAGNNTSMSPFFIAFLGITSGFLANVALDVIESTGKALFRAQTDKERARWAYGLKKALTESAKARTGKADLSEDDVNKEVEVLATAIQVDPSKVTAWTDLKETVPSSYQRYISIYFRMHPREIFTDVPESDVAGAT